MESGLSGIVSVGVLLQKEGMAVVDWEGGDCMLDLGDWVGWGVWVKAGVIRGEGKE